MNNTHTSLIMAVCLVTAISYHPITAQAKTYAGCAKVVSKIEKIQRKMRQGYSAEQGEQYKARLLYLKEQRNKCERHAEKNLQAQATKAKNRQQSKKNVTNYNYYQTQSNWSYTQTSASRNSDWQAMQDAENKRIKLLNKKYAGAIKDAKQTKDDN